jgi:hypothetical protein
MTAFDAVLREVGTGATVRPSRADAVCLARPVMPVGFALVGELTAATACAAPEVLDWTSADVVELAWPFMPVQGGPPGAVEIVDLTETAVQRQINELKRRSGLTWTLFAEAVGVDVRAVHLWRRGGGISAGHEQRLNELTSLIDSIDLGVAADTRAELLEAAPGGSLLERLQAGEPPRELFAAAPWRSRVWEQLEGNIRARNEGEVIEEDYVFLLYLDDDGVRAFADRATALLNQPEMTRREWEALIDAQFVQMEQPAAVEIEADASDLYDYEDEYGAPMLFRPADLGIPLGVGAIAGRRALHERA